MTGDFGGNLSPASCETELALACLGSIGAEVQAWEPTAVMDLVVVFRASREEGKLIAAQWDRGEDA